MALFPVYDMGVEHSFASVGDSWAPGTVISQDKISRKCCIGFGINFCSFDFAFTACRTQQLTTPCWNFHGFCFCINQHACEECENLHYAKFSRYTVSCIGRKGLGHIGLHKCYNRYTTLSCSLGNTCWTALQVTLGRRVNECTVEPARGIQSFVPVCESFKQSEVECYACSWATEPHGWPFKPVLMPAYYIVQGGPEANTQVARESATICQSQEILLLE